MCRSIIYFCFIIVTGLFLISPTTLVAQLSSTTYEQKSSSFSNGSASVQSSNFQLRGTIGQPLAGSVTSTSYNLSSGFVQSILEPEPLLQPTTIIFSNVTESSIEISFTSAEGVQGGYLVLRRASAPPTGQPVDGVIYSVGNTIGDGTVISVSSSLQFTDSGLLAGTIYHYAAYSFNGSAGTNNYLIINPLRGDKITKPAAPDISLGNPTVSNFYVNWNAVPSATGYKLDVSENNGFTSFVGGGEYNGKDIPATPPLQTNVTGLLAGKEYFVRMRAVNASGESAHSEYSSITTSVNPGTPPLSVTLSPYLNSPTANISITLSDGSGVRTVKFYSKGILQENFNSPVTLTSTSDNYTTTLNASMLDELGIEFYFTAEDASIITPKRSPANNNAYIYTPIAANEKAITNLSFGGKGENYRIISIPYNLGSNNTVQEIFFPVLDEYDKEKWRLIQYDPLTKKNKDYPAFNRLDLGKGYWFNSIEKVDVRVGSGTAPQFNQATPFTMRLEQGWNQIGAPYPFDIKWSAVQSANSGKTVGKLFVFNPTTQTMVESNDLKAWSGGFVHADNVITDFTYPVTLKNASGGRNEANDLIDNTRLDEPIWFIPIILKQGGAESRIAVGMHPEASTGKDRFDQIAVPRFFNYLEMTTTHPDFFSPAFAYDVVPTQSYQTWNFIFNSSFITSSAILEWDPQSLGDNEAVLILFDEREKTFVNMRETNRYVLPAFKDYPLKIIYASKQEWNPGVTLLGNPFPNPTSTQVTIPVALHEPASVQISVYDLAGKKVKSLAVDYWEAGMHSVTWQCDDELSTKVPPAIYFVRMAVGSRSFTQKIMVK